MSQAEGPGGKTDRETCVDCDQRAPKTETNYTLISQRYGWRLTRKVLPNGTKVLEWRCPECHGKRRELTGPLSGVPSSDGRRLRNFRSLRKLRIERLLFGIIAITDNRPRNPCFADCKV